MDWDHCRLPGRRSGAQSGAGRSRSLVTQLLTDPAPRESIPISGMVLLATLLLSPLVLAAVLEGPLPERLEQASHMALLLQNISVLGAAVVLRYEWQVAGSAATGWLAVAVGFLAVQNLPFSLLLVAGSPLGAFGTVNGVATTVTGIVTVSFLALGVARVPAPRPNPLILAVGVGIVVAGLRLAGARSGIDPTLDLPVSWLAALDLAAALLALWVVVQLLRCRDLPLWFRRYVVGATVLLTASAGPAPGSAVAGMVAVVAGVAGVVLLLGAAIGLLRSTLRAQTRRVVELTTRVMEAEHAARLGHERAHELTATVAGIAHASRLVLEDDGPAPRDKQRLTRLLQAELERLERLAGIVVADPETDISLDAVVEPVVEVHRALGHDIRFTPSGLRVQGRADDLAEVMHVLVSNAARHAPGARVEVVARRRGHVAEIRVRDEGPGIAPSVVGRLFQWGGRHPDSPGQGIGLQLARRLMLGLGGDLRYEPSTRGACFVVVVPLRSVTAQSPG